MGLGIEGFDIPLVIIHITRQLLEKLFQLDGLIEATYVP